MCHLSLGSIEAEFCFPGPPGWALHVGIFWIQKPECVVLVAAVSGAGGSSRDMLLLLLGERGLYCLPLSHIFTPAGSVSVLLFSLQYSLYSGCSFSPLEYSFPVWKHW